MEQLIPSGELYVKYKKLASEYSKLKLHVKVLKRGVLDEQTKVNELRVLLKDKDKECRKSELEIDSLKFRNQQLTKRVTVLLDDLQNIQLKIRKTGKGKSESKSPHLNASATVDNDVIQEELHNKIVESANFASQLTDRTVEISQLKFQLEELERKLAESDSTYKCETTKLKNRNNELELNIEELLKERGANTPSKILSCHHVSNAADGGSEIGSTFGSEDALSSCDAKSGLLHEELQKLRMEHDLLKMENDSLILKNNNLSSLTDKRTRSESHGSGDYSFSWTTVDKDGRVVGLIGNSDVPFVLCEEVLQRENNLKKYFRNQLTEISVEKQAIESRVDHILSECESLKIRYEDIEKMREEDERTMKAKHGTIKMLEDELQSTAKNYENQISVLSEHLAQLNDTIAEQHEQIENLKVNMSKKQ